MKKSISALSFFFGSKYRIFLSVFSFLIFINEFSKYNYGFMGSHGFSGWIVMFIYAFAFAYLGALIGCVFNLFVLIYNKLFHKNVENFVRTVNVIWTVLLIANCIEIYTNVKNMFG